MKFLWSFVMVVSLTVYGQDYQLLPDTCTYCSFYYSLGGATSYVNTYYLDSEKDTLFGGHTYLQIPSTGEAYLGPVIFGMRQVGNKVFGVAESDSTQEYLIQDWDLNIGDTIYDLYSNRTYYDAIFISEDSLILNDGSYHHYREMQGIGLAPNGSYVTNSWTFYWHERGLCAEHAYPTFANAGGLLFNLPGYQYGSIHPVYYLPKPHTADLRYNMDSLIVNCDFTGSLQKLHENELNPNSVFPNPTTDFIYLQNIKFDISRIQIIDFKGNILINSHFKNNAINISKFEDGIYVLRLYNSEGTYRQTKIIKTQ